jgi:hypothetical protein
MILFLDIDGVLHPFFPREDRIDAENQHLSYLPHFETVLRDFPAVRLVIASDWRKRHTLDELRHLLGDLGSRLIGATPVLEKIGLDWTGHRQREAMAWLEAEGLADVRWIALDDDAENYLPDAPLILCADGFRDEEESALRAALEFKNK